MEANVLPLTSLMLNAKLVESLSQVAPPVLTAYLDTIPTDPRNLRQPPRYFIWLKSQCQALEANMQKPERKAFHEQVQRVEEYLTQSPPATRGLVIFANPKIWQVIALRVDTIDELFWGLPSVSQLLWLVEEHRHCGVVLANRSVVRLFHYWMAELVEEHRETPKIDTSEWKRKDLKPPSQPGIEMLRGSHRDAFERRMEAQYARFYSAESAHVRAWAERENLNPIFLFGPPKVVEMLHSDLPKAIQSRTVMVQKDLEHLPIAEFQARVESELRQWELGYERSLVDRLLDGSGSKRAVLGVDDTLVGLQEGLARDTVVVRGIQEQVQQCTNCGWTDRAPDKTCPACGGTRLLTALRSVLPRLTKRYKVPLEIIADGNGEKLRNAGGGIGALLK
jgi:Bacterial archaeo-eukaryotic release factor family 10